VPVASTNSESGWNIRIAGSRWPSSVAW
jgi:hypothetical protein